MADVRVIQNIVISDPTTPSQIAAVDASGHLQVDIAASSATVTVDTELAAAGALADNTANPTVTSVGTFPHWWDGVTWDRAPGTAADGLLVNLGANNDITVTGTVTVDTELPAAGALADATANPTVPAVGAFLMGWNGTTWDRVDTANTGRLQVDVITGGSAETPTNPINNYDTSAAIAAGSADNHDTADLGGTTKKCTQIIFGASVALKVELQEVENGSVISTLAVGFSPAGQTVALSPAHRDYWSVAFSANAGFDGFRLARTNLDASEAADVYSVIQYED